MLLHSASVVVSQSSVITGKVRLAQPGRLLEPRSLPSCCSSLENQIGLWRPSPMRVQPKEREGGHRPHRGRAERQVSS